MLLKFTIWGAKHLTDAEAKAHGVVSKFFTGRKVPYSLEVVKVTGHTLTVKPDEGCAFNVDYEVRDVTVQSDVKFRFAESCVCPSAFAKNPKPPTRGHGIGGIL